MNFLRKYILAAALFGACLLVSVNAWAWPGKVISVHDGDTITVERPDGTREKIRLFGVDCPETQVPGHWESQPFSRVAADFARDLLTVEDGAVDVAIWEMGESYGRIVGGVITLHDGYTVQELLVQAGLAWVDPRYCKVSQVKECRNWMAVEREAIEHRRGLWAALDWEMKPVAPWTWRGREARTGRERHSMEGEE